MRIGVAAAVVGDDLVPGDLEVEDGLITGIGLSGAGSGTALPGFIDLHTHGFDGVDFASGYTGSSIASVRAVGILRSRTPGQSFSGLMSRDLSLPRLTREHTPPNYWSHRARR
mgnify:CR=1 FL=1